MSSQNFEHACSQCSLFVFDSSMTLRRCRLITCTSTSRHKSGFSTELFLVNSYSIIYYQFPFAFKKYHTILYSVLMRIAKTTFEQKQFQCHLLDDVCFEFWPCGKLETWSLKCYKYGENMKVTKRCTWQSNITIIFQVNHSS